MGVKNSLNQELKAIKALLTPEDVRKAREAADIKGMKLQAFYGQAIRNAIKEVINGNPQ